MADQRRTAENITQALREARKPQTPTSKTRDDRPTTEEIRRGLSERLKDLRNR